jgi:holo-ACP synthase/triphosphoribosyl-dephospho-CoA synthase
LKAILHEISVSPKPGLVGRFEQGAHHDMDYFTFVSSTSALAGYFEELAMAGYTFRGNSLHEALPEIRTIGLQMESSMFLATNGVNTQKGLIFLIGLALFSAAYCIARDGAFEAGRCRETIAAICTNLVQNELLATRGGDETHGKTCFRKYGPAGGGVRSEAEGGLPSVFEQGLPGLRSALAGAGENAAAATINGALTETLLRLMTVTNDANILYRKDMCTLKTVQHMAQNVIDAKDAALAAERYEQLLRYCQSENVSPGGSADLLAVTVFLYFVERSFPVHAKSKGTD